MNSRRLKILCHQAFKETALRKIYLQPTFLVCFERRTLIVVCIIAIWKKPALILVNVSHRQNLKFTVKRTGWGKSKHSIFNAMKPKSMFNIFNAQELFIVKAHSHLRFRATGPLVFWNGLFNKEAGCSHPVPFVPILPGHTFLQYPVATF